MRTTNGTMRALWLREDRRYLRLADQRIEKFRSVGLDNEAERVCQKRACICMAQMLGTHWHGNSELQAQVKSSAMERKPI